MNVIASERSPRSSSALAPLVAALTLLAGCTGSSSSGSSATQTLSGSLAPGPGLAGDVLDVWLTSDSSRAIYLADQERDDVFELFVVPVDGSQAALPLLPPAPADRPSIPRLLLAEDNQRAAVVADRDEEGVYRIYGVSLDGSQDLVELEGPTAPGGTLSSAWITPDGARVVSVADWNADGVYTLRSVRVDGTEPPLDLGVTLVQADLFDLNLRLSPDGAWIVYRADVGSGVELFAVPVDGSQPAARRSAALVAGGDVSPEYAFAPDGSRLVYRADQDVDELFELYSVPLDGGGPVEKLNGALPSIGVDRFRVRPDSAGVVYSVFTDTFGEYELHQARFGGAPGGSLFERSGSLGVGSSGPACSPCFGGPRIGFGTFEISPDASTVVYVTPSGTEIVSLSLEVGAPARQLNLPLLPGETIDASGFEIASDGGRLAYFVRAPGGLQRELMSVPLDGSKAPVRLDAAPSFSRGFESARSVFLGNGVLGVVGLPTASLRITADARFAVYLAGTSNALDLYGTPLDGSAAPRRLNDALPVGSTVQRGFELRGGAAVFLADAAVEKVVEAFSAAVDGSSPRVSLSPLLVVPGTGDVQRFRANPAGPGALYLADEEVLELDELYAASGGAPRRLSSLVGPGATIFDFTFTPDGTQAVYAADQDTDGVVELFSAAFDASAGSGANVNLSRAQGASVPLAFAEFPPPLVAVSPASTRCVFVGLRPSGERFGLYSVRVDGTEAPLELTASLSGDAGLPATFFGQVFEVSADGSRVVFLVDEDGVALYSAPLDGSSAPVRLHQDLLPAEGVSGFRLTPDGASVAFFVASSGPVEGDLYRAPVDGSSPAERLPNATGYGQGFAAAITPDAQRIVFPSRALAQTQGIELFSVLLDGSEEPTRIGGSVRSQPDHPLVFTPDSEWVVFLSNHETGAQEELFSARVTGVGVPRRLSPALGDDGFVGLPFPGFGVFGVGPPFLGVASDSSRVLFQARAEGDTTFALYSSPVDALDPPARLTEDGRFVSPYAFLPDARRVIFRAGGSPDNVFELFSAPADGSSPAMRLNPPLVSGGSIGSFALDATGTRVLYLADQEVENRFELFSVPVGDG